LYASRPKLPICQPSTAVAERYSTRRPLVAVLTTDGVGDAVSASTLGLL